MNLNTFMTAVYRMASASMRRLFSAKSLVALLGLSLVLEMSGCSLLSTGVLNPKGVIAAQEKELLFDSIALMLIVVIPVIIMSFAFAFRYRASRNATYKPDWSHSYLIEAVCWGVPLVIIVILGIWTWEKSHSLDPYKEIDVPGKPLLIEAVALPWKWLFIYPEQNIATVNYVEMPRNRQVQFYLTNDNVPMSAFFIPQLGSQIYTMAGMRTRLHLLANEDGEYEGLNSQFNGDGFSEMRFKADVVDNAEFNKWVGHVKQVNAQLEIPEYLQLQKPAVAVPVQYFSAVKPNLFERIMDQYMMPNMQLK